MSSPDNAAALHLPKRYTWTVVALFWLAAAMLALGVCPYYRFNPDSALYTGIARSLARGEGYTFSGAPQASIPPVVPYYLSLACRLARFVEPGAPFLSTFIYFNAFTAAAAMAGYIIAFFLLYEWGGARRGLMAFALLVLCHKYFAFGIEPMTEAMYCALSWAALLYLARVEKEPMRGRRILAAVLLPLSVMTRVAGVTLAAAVAALWAWRYLFSREMRATAAANLGMVFPSIAAAAAFFINMSTSRGGGAFNYIDDVSTGRNFHEIALRMAANLAGLPAYVFETITNLESIAGIGLILAAVVALGAWRMWREGMKLPAVYTVLYVLFVGACYEVKPRYIVPLLPMVFLWTIAGFSYLLSVLRPAARKHAGRVLRVLAALVIAANLFEIGRAIRLNYSADFYANLRHGAYVDYISLARRLLKDPPQGRIMARQMRIIYALTELPTAWLPYHPDASYRPSPADTARYVEQMGITTLVTDTEDKVDEKIFTDFVGSDPAWRRTAKVGRLTLYEKEPPPQ